MRQFLCAILPACLLAENFDSLFDNAALPTPKPTPPPSFTPTIAPTPAPSADPRYMLQLTCSDGILDGDESDIDCGGKCYPCGAGMTCFSDRDCTHGKCKDDSTCPGERISGVPVPHKHLSGAHVKKHADNPTPVPTPPLPPSLYEKDDYVQVNYRNSDEWFLGNIVALTYTGKKTGYVYRIQYNDGSLSKSVKEKFIKSAMGRKKNKDGPEKLRKRAYRFFGQAYKTPKPVAQPTYSPTNSVTPAPTISTAAPTRSPTYRPTTQMKCTDKFHCTVCEKAAHACCVVLDIPDGWACGECARKHGCFDRVITPFPTPAPKPSPRKHSKHKRKEHRHMGVKCKPGKYMNADECWACPKGKYTVSWDSNLCIASDGGY